MGGNSTLSGRLGKDTQNVHPSVQTVGQAFVGGLQEQPSQYDLSELHVTEQHVDVLDFQFVVKCRLIRFHVSKDVALHGSTFVLKNHGKQGHPKFTVWDWFLQSISENLIQLRESAGRDALANQWLPVLDQCVWHTACIRERE